MEFNYNLYPGKNIKDDEFSDLKEITPEISIITAYYNGHKYIDETANSILNQTYPYWEWLIIDDGSTNEESLNKLEELSKLDSRIKVIHKKNGGLAETRDYGASKSDKNAKYLFFIDDDDLIESTYLECAYWTLETNKEATWAYTDLVNFDGMEFKWIKEFDSEVEKKDNLLVATALIRKKDFFKVNGYELREKAVNEDWNLWLKFLAKGMYPIRMNFIGFWYRKKPENESELARSKENKTRALEIIENTSKKITEKVEAVQYPKYDYNWDEIIEKVPTISVPRKNKNNKTKILMIIPWMTTGGADKFNLDLVTRIDRNKFEITIITTEPNINNWRQLFDNQVTVYDLTTFLNQKYWISFINYIIKANNIEIIFNTNSTFGYSALPYLKANFPNIPIIDYVHMEEWYNRNGGYSRDSSSESSIISKTLVCNRNSEKILVDYFKRKPSEVETVYIGVDEEKFNPKKYDREEILKKYNIKNDKNKKIITYIARIDIQKRPLLLIEIIKKLKQNRNDFIIIIAGDGPLLKEIKRKTQIYNLEDDIIFLGNVSKTEEIYKISDLTVNCSIKEGLALTSYESLAMGVPVVSSNVGGQAELINSDVGEIVPCIQKEVDVKNFNYSDEEIENYVLAIEKVLDNLELYKKNSRKRILNGFTINQMILKMSEIFEKVKLDNNNENEFLDLAKYKDITKELITKYFVMNKNEYQWLCDNVNIQYFRKTIINRGEKKDEYQYDYFKTFKGRCRLKVIAITKKMHVYDLIKKIIRGA